MPQLRYSDLSAIANHAPAATKLNGPPRIGGRLLLRMPRRLQHPRTCTLFCYRFYNQIRRFRPPRDRVHMSEPQDQRAAVSTDARSDVEEARRRLRRFRIEQLRRTEQRMVAARLERLLGYPMVADAIERGELALHGWHYVIELGRVLMLDVATGQLSD